MVKTKPKEMQKLDSELIKCSQTPALVVIVGGSA